MKGSRLFFALVCLLLAAACGSGTDKPVQGTPIAPAEMFFVQNHPFSNSEMPDIFTIGYYGPRLLDTLVYFRIISSIGDTLHTVTWPAHAFLDGLEDPGSDSLREAEVLRQMQAIVNDQSVSDSVKATLPPVPADASGSFVYRVGHQPAFRICWSTSLKKVIPG